MPANMTITSASLSSMTRDETIVSLYDVLEFRIAPWIDTAWRVLMLEGIYAFDTHRPINKSVVPFRILLRIVNSFFALTIGCAAHCFGLQLKYYWVWFFLLDPFCAMLSMTVIMELMRRNTVSHRILPWLSDPKCKSC